VQRLVLQMPAQFRFHAGQYLEILHPGGPIPLSIASAPRRLPELHLHYLSLAGAPEARRMDELLERGGPLTVRGPGGDVRLPAPLPAPALIVAGGTGIAQAMSFVDSFAEADPGAHVTLLWCVDSETDWYLRDTLEALDAPWLEAVLVADPERSSRNRGLGWMQQHGRTFAGGRPPCPVVLAGGAGFVHAAYDTLLAAGVEPAQVQSDVFSYAPRT
jgi:CDP-4-dehydro-6-deoxyglucose reductase